MDEFQGLGTVLDNLSIGAYTEDQAVSAIESELGKIAARKGGSVAARAASRKLAKLAVQQQRGFLQDTTTRPMKFMLANIHNLDKETQKAIQEKSIIQNFADLYRRGAYTGGGSGTLEIWNNTNIQLKGISNVDKNFLPNNVNMVVEKIRFCYALTDVVEGATTPSNAQLGGVYWLDVNTVGGISSNITKSPIPAQVLNAELLLKINDQVVFSTPVSRLINNSINGGNTSGLQREVDNYLQLDSLILLKERQPFIWELQFPEGAPLAAPGAGQFHAFAIHMAGTKTQPGARA